jgi:HD-like signal output (HDOD) protein
VNSALIDSIKSLPPLSKTIIDINKVYSDEEAGIGDLAKVIDSDPMIVANLLKAANSPLYSFGKEIKNVSQAVSLFGMSMTRSIALGNAVRKLLNVDLQPYNITSDKFAEISSLQAALISSWYKKVDKQKEERLHLAAFLQETGAILISNNIIQDNEITSFSSEIEMSNSLAMVEKSYVNMTSAEVTALVFKHWGFDNDFIDMIRYSDVPMSAPEDIREYSMALNIVKTIIPLNKPLSEMAINFGLKKARDAGYNHELLEDSVDDILDLM